MQSTAVRIKAFHPEKQFWVEIDGVSIGRKLRGLVGFDLLQRLVGVCAIDGFEGALDTLEHLARLFHRNNRIVEAGLCLVVRNLRELDEAFLYGLVISRTVVAILDPIEGRSLQWQGAPLSKRICIRRENRRCGSDEGSADGSCRDKLYANENHDVPLSDFARSASDRAIV